MFAYVRFRDDNEKRIVPVAACKHLKPNDTSDFNPRKWYKVFWKDETHCDHYHVRSTTEDDARKATEKRTSIPQRPGSDSSYSCSSNEVDGSFEEKKNLVLCEGCSRKPEQQVAPLPSPSIPGSPEVAHTSAREADYVPTDGEVHLGKGITIPEGLYSRLMSTKSETRFVREAAIAIYSTAGLLHKNVVGKTKMSHGGDPDASAVIQGKGQLDLDRPCGAVGSGETCWLCEDFPAWNSVIHALNLELAETAPGTLRLHFVPNSQKEDLMTAAREASVILSSLLCHHLCIQEVYLECVFSTNTPAPQPLFPISMRRQSSSPASRSLRKLRISESGSLVYRYCPANASVHLDLRDMDAVIGLQTLYVDLGRFSQCFAAEIDALLERNRNTLKNVEIFEARPAQNKLRMVEHLAACKVLALKSLEYGDIAAPDVDGMVSLLRGPTTLKEASVKPVLPRQLLLIAKALETNCCLTKLTLYVKTRDSVEELFAALEVNKHLKELFLNNVFYNDLNSSCMRAVASALKNNKCLQTLCMSGLNLPGGEMGQWSRALSKNDTLQLLSIHCKDIPISDVSALCEALRVNRSLKKLKLSEVRGSEEERSSLARQLLEGNCYDRVHLGHWTEPYLRVLSPVLASSDAGTTELWLSNIGELSHDSVSALFNALASNKKVTSLKMDVMLEPDHRVALLCETLKKNRFIEFLSINICNGNCANEILRALTVNSGITKLEMALRVPAVEKTAAAFSDMLSRNSAITNISVDFDTDDPQPLLEAYAQGLSGNRLIYRAGYGVRGGSYIPPSLNVPVRRNRASLNRAMDFVLERREDRHCVECFELFFGRSYLISSLVEIAEMSDVEARVGVASAENRRQEKYMILAGVVQRSVVCWPADVTQIDALNWECWRAIARYLKVADICLQ
ncbi:hypothetical protein HPB52_002197 [Rhipicephalus sanguineus]|uniref:Uncharacterized protein n=1 Tax=Rhipicephalus sanguineus TaxID=34632 RepID=A0A9D4PDY5_RHISA|nr:hypothetical protein HPB52_002197 [Rhipicephalus sanguineus]